MKVVLLVMLMLVASNSFASKARLEAFGENSYGSFLFDDYRNIYLNMAAINDYANFATLELGKDSDGVDSSDSPVAEGGVVVKAGNLVYGVHFGYASAALNTFRTNILGAAPTAVAASDNTTAAPAARTLNLAATDVVDLMVGGKSGNMKWGFALQYSGTKDERYVGINASQKAAALRAGIYNGPLRAGLIFNLANSVEYNHFTALNTSTKKEFDGKLGFELNGSYDIAKNIRVFGKYQSLEADGKNVNLNNLKATKMEIGITKRYDFSKTAFMFTKFGINKYKSELVVNPAVAARSGEKSDFFFPASIGMEGQPKDWLKIRGSLGMELYGTTEYKGSYYLLGSGKAGKITRSNSGETGTSSATANAGMTLLFGELEIDGLIGTTSADSTADNNTAATSKEGVLSLSNLMTRVSMTYSF